MSDIRLLTSALRSARFRFSSEDELQAGVAEVMAAAGVAFDREVAIGQRDRLDFLAGTAAIEVKVDGGRNDLLRQLARYARHDGIQDLVVVTSRARHARLPDLIGSKPIHVVWVSGGAL